MVYGLCKPCWLTHATCTCFKETARLLNVHFVDFILCPTDKYMFKANNGKVKLIYWMCSNLRLNTIWHYSGVFIIEFDQSQYINIVFLLLNLNKDLSVGSERQVIIFCKHEKRHICFVIKVARSISFSDLSLHQIEINYEQMTIPWTYYRTVESFFMVGGGEVWLKMLATIVVQRQKLKKHWLKRPKVVPKNEIWTKIQIIQNLIFRNLYLKILLRACNAFMFIHTFQWTHQIIRLFLNFQIF